MENILLNVQTVPAFDVTTYSDHTAYTVFATNGGRLATASGWTLRDAIDLYSKLYKVDRPSESGSVLSGHKSCIHFLSRQQTFLS